MTWQAPGFWQTEAGRNHPLSVLLSPLGSVYGAAVAGRIARARPMKAGVPVVCAGNVTLGGVGKTPFTAMLGRLLRDDGSTPHVLSRGYGGRAKGPLRVEPRRHDAAAVGDEPLVLARDLPVWIGADRCASAMAAIGAGADVLLMDDGFQNPSLVKDFSFLLLDAAAPLGNGRVFPAGPLREPLSRALSRAEAIIAVRAAPGPAPTAIAALAKGRPVIAAWMEPDLSRLDLSRPLHALTGIARPQRFFDALERAGARLSGRTAFPDHHPFTAEEVEGALAAAGREGAILVTTAKDQVRIPNELRPRVSAVPAAMIAEDEARLLSLLSPLLKHAS